MTKTIGFWKLPEPEGSRSALSSHFPEAERSSGACGSLLRLLIPSPGQPSPLSPLKQSNHLTACDQNFCPELCEPGQCHQFGFNDPEEPFDHEKTAGVGSYNHGRACDPVPFSGDGQSDELQRLDQAGGYRQQDDGLIWTQPLDGLSDTGCRISHGFPQC